MARALTLLLPCLLAACTRAPRSDPQSVLPSVVLLVNERAGAPTRYGAGVMLDDGTILTNAHVVAQATRLRAMIFDPARRSYSPLDGGLSRFLFENDRALIPATLLREDRTADLALVGIGATPPRKKLVLREDKPRLGERVFALGHPQEGVWSLTSGIVAGERDGLVQHDAPVSGGSSGGPLVDALGRIVGINTSKVVSEAGGAGFARDVEYVRRFLKGDGGALDLSTLEAAALGCMRAQELGSPVTADCFDWDARYAIYEESIAEATKQLDAVRVSSLRARLPSKGEWIAAQKKKVAEYFTGQKKAPGGCEGATDDCGAMIARTGLKTDLSDNSEVQRTLKKGLRLERVHHFGGDKAWVHFSGRNMDDTPYAFSECWQRHGDRWLQRSPPWPSDLQALPRDFPGPLESHEVIRRKYLSSVLERADRG